MLKAPDRMGNVKDTTGAAPVISGVVPVIACTG
jgi:hypothetical protein